MQLRLSPGRTSGSAAQTIRLCGLTVFVGPNNSGKSLVLEEIGRYCNQPHNGQPRKIAADFELSPLGADEAEFLRLRFERDPPSNQTRQDGRFFYAFKGGIQNVGEQEFSAVMLNPIANPMLFRQLYLNNLTLNLGGANRINLTGPQGTGDLLHPDPFQAFQVLFSQDSLRDKVRSILHRAFGRFFVLDPTTGGQLNIRFAERPPASIQEEQGLHKEAREFFASATPIAELSDGVKAFTGIITQIIAGEPRVVLIDEPEAFLHPPLAQQLGSEIATFAGAASKNFFVSTHSANFVMGCLQSGSPVDIVRLTYRDGVPTARVLKNDDLLALTRHPLLRSTGVINALFYECVVVTESDSDRAFYQEINERLLRYSPTRGIPNCLFLNAQNKQTTRLITKPLRELGIPALSIVDIDVLKEGGCVWMDFLESGFIPQLDRSSFATSRDVLNAELKRIGKNMKTEGGIHLFDSNGQESAGNLFDRLEEYGLFVVRGGEAEFWLKHLGAKGHGSNWLVEMFEKLGDDPTDSSYVVPTEGDVWSFIERARGWLLSNERKGIPP